MTEQRPCKQVHLLDGKPIDVPDHDLDLNTDNFAPWKPVFIISMISGYHCWEEILASFKFYACVMFINITGSIYQLVTMDAPHL